MEKQFPLSLGLVVHPVPLQVFRNVAAQEPRLALVDFDIGVL
jgi:hypothetical protein